MNHRLQVRQRRRIVIVIVIVMHVVKRYDCSNDCHVRAPEIIKRSSRHCETIGARGANNRFHSEQSSQLRRKPQPIVSMIKRSASSPNEPNVSKSQTIGSTIKRSYDLLNDLTIVLARNDCLEISNDCLPRAAEAPRPSGVYADACSAWVASPTDGELKAQMRSACFF